MADLVGPLKVSTLTDCSTPFALGNAYVNVHARNDTTTPGLGNFPGGEIRGQLDVHQGEGEEGDGEN